jgi:hypothetical protein
MRAGKVRPLERGRRRRVRARVERVCGGMNLG